MEINEVTHIVKGANYLMKRIDSRTTFPTKDGVTYLHNVIKGKMKNGEVYAVDFTGAQYGWRQMIMPWELYSSSRIEEVKKVSPFGYTKVLTRMRSSMTEQAAWVHQINEGFACNVEGAILLWEMRNGPVRDILRLPEPEFDTKLNHLLGTIDGFVTMTKVEQESTGAFDVEDRLDEVDVARKMAAMRLD